jgi:predicted permease
MSIFDDIRQAGRRLAMKPAFTAIALLTLTLGIGFNAAVYRFVDGYLLRPLPISEPNRVFSLTFGSRGERTTASWPNYIDIRDHNAVLSGAAAVRIMHMSLNHASRTDRLWGYLVTGNYFDLLGLHAWRGRLLVRDDDQRTGERPVIVLSYGCWQRRFGGDEQIVGRTVRINAHPFMVVGITPPGFVGTERVFAPDVWVPFSMIRVIENRDWREWRTTHNAWVIGRLKAGVSLLQARASLEVLAARIAHEHPADSEDFHIDLAPTGLLGNALRGPFIGFAAGLGTVAGLVLLIVCANISGLLLSRAADRRKEIAIRLAIGAGYGTIVRLILTESLLLALGGGLLGGLASLWFGNVIQAVVPMADFPVNLALGTGWPLIAFSVAAAVITASISGLLPALGAARLDPISALRNQADRGLGRGLHLRDLFVGLQVVVCVVLLAGAVMMTRTLQGMLASRFGFDTDSAVTLRVDLDMLGYKRDRGRVFQERLLHRVRAVPGIDSAGVANSLPLSVDQSMSTIYVEGRALPRLSDVPSAIVYQSDPGFFEALGTHLLAGRDLSERDTKDSPKVAVVNRIFADKILGRGDPLGRSFRFGPSGDPVQIVGVVEGGKYQTLTEDPEPVVWQPLSQSYNGATSIVARTKLPPDQALRLIRGAVTELDPDLAVFDAKSLRDYLDLPLAPLRLATSALTAMGVLAVFLCAVGMYGLLSYSVSRRTREIGIRVALGAQRGNVLGVTLRRVAILAGISGLVGLGLAVVVTRFLGSVMMAKPDATVFAVALVLLVAITMPAAMVPALRALRIDLARALRQE